jgi:hypothetical protein
MEYIIAYTFTFVTLLISCDFDEIRIVESLLRALSCFNVDTASDQQKVISTASELCSSMCWILITVSGLSTLADMYEFE